MEGIVPQLKIQLPKNETFPHRNMGSYNFFNTIIILWYGIPFAKKCDVLNFPGYIKSISCNGYVLRNVHYVICLSFYSTNLAVKRSSLSRH